MLGQPVDGRDGLFFEHEGVELALAPYTGWQAAGWASVADWAAIVPRGLDAESFELVSEWLSDRDDPFTLGVCYYMAEQLAETIYGMPWWAAVRLSAMASTHWRYYSLWCAEHAFDPVRSSAPLICASSLKWLRDSAKDDAEWSIMETKVFLPPPARRQEHVTSLDDFVAQMNTMGSGDDDDDD